MKSTPILRNGVIPEVRFSTSETSATRLLMVECALLMRARLIRISSEASDGTLAVTTPMPSKRLLRMVWLSLAFVSAISSTGTRTCGCSGFSLFLSMVGLIPKRFANSVMFSEFANAQHASLKAFCLVPRNSHIESVASITNTQLKKNGTKTKPQPRILSHNGQ